MYAEQLADVITNFAQGFPREIGKQLIDVEIMVFATPELATEELGEILDTDDGKPIDPIPADCKGAFIGEQMESEDEDEESELETVALPNGVIALIASNISDANEAIVILLHELGHALGMDEEEVKALGLGVSPATDPSTGASNGGVEAASVPPARSDQL